MRYFILALLILGPISWAAEEVQVADAYVHPETKMVLFRVERADRPRSITFMQREHFSPDVTEGPYPIGWYYYKPGSGIAYQQRLVTGDFWSIRENHIDFHFSILARDEDPYVEVIGKYEKLPSGG